MTYKCLEAVAFCFCWGFCKARPSSSQKMQAVLFLGCQNGDHTGLEKYLNSTLPVGQVSLKFCLLGALPRLQACLKFNVINPSWRNKVCEAVVVRSCTYFLVPVLHAGYLRFYKALSQLVQFVGDCVRLLECSPASCLALRNHREGEARHIFHAQNEQQIAFPLQFWHRHRAYFFFIWVNEKIVSLEGKHLCLNETLF